MSATFPGAHNAFTSQLDNPVFALPLARVDRFLVSLGFIDTVSDVEQHIAARDPCVEAENEAGEDGLGGTVHEVRAWVRGGSGGIGGGA